MLRFFLLMLLTQSCDDDSPTRSPKISEAISEMIGSSSGLDFVYSLFYPQITGQSLDEKKAKSKAIAIRSSFEKTKMITPENLEKFVSFQRIAKISLDETLNDLKKMSQISSGKLDLNLSETMRLNLALIAIQSKKIAMAEFYLSDLTTSNSKTIAAAAFNALGLSAFWDERFPEALLFFQKAIETNSSFQAASLNLGFLALKLGHLDLARKHLTGLDHWYASLGLITVARLSEDEKSAAEHCVNLNAKNSKIAFINCSLLEAQNQKNQAKAKETIKKAVSISIASKEINDLAQKLLTKIK